MRSAKFLCFSSRSSYARAEDNQTIGLLICKSKDDTVVEWSFEGLERPIGVAEYEKEIKKMIEDIPTPKQI